MRTGASVPGWARRLQARTLTPAPGADTVWSIIMSSPTSPQPGSLSHCHNSLLDRSMLLLSFSRIMHYIHFKVANIFGFSQWHAAFVICSARVYCSLSRAWAGRAWGPRPLVTAHCSHKPDLRLSALIPCNWLSQPSSLQQSLISRWDDLRIT